MTTRDAKKKSQNPTEGESPDMEAKMLLRNMAAQLQRLEKLIEAKASKQSVDELASRVDSLETRSESREEESKAATEQLNERVERLEASGNEEQAAEIDIERIVKEQVQKGINEYRERENRKFNLILHNVPESQKEDVEERRDEDIESADEIMAEIGCSDIKIETAIRLGKVTEGKTRLLKVRLPSSTKKRVALSNAKRLRQSSSDTLKKVFISPDLSPEAREDGRKLRQQLKVRREQGELNLVIRKGAIMKAQEDQLPFRSGTTQEEPGGNSAEGLE